MIHFKKSIFVIGTVLVFGSLITGCNHSLKYEKKEVQRSEDNAAAYRVFSATDGKFTYQFGEYLFQEELAQKVVKEVQTFQEKAEKYTGVKVNQKINLCVLEETPYGGTYLKDHTVYCTLSDLDKGNYKPYLMQAFYNLKQPWTAFGITQNISSKGVDSTDLKKHYSVKENLVDLTLFGGCFLKDISREEDYKVAVSTSSQLVDYLVKNKKTDQMIKETIGKKEKQDWLTSIGVKEKYSEPGEEAFGRAAYGKNSQCVLEIKDSPTTFQMNLIPLIKNSADMRDWVIEDYLATSKMAFYMEKYLNIKPDYKKVTQNNYLLKADYRDSSYNEKENTNYYTIDSHVFGFRSAFSLVLAGKDKSNNWKDFIVSYVLASNSVTEPGKGTAQDYQRYMDERVDDKLISQQEYDVYLKNDTDYLQNHQIDLRLVWDIFALYRKDQNEIIAHRWRILPTQASEEEKLTTYEEISFINYINANYGEDVVVRRLLCNEVDQKLTGKSKQELLTEWRNYLKTLK